MTVHIIRRNYKKKNIIALTFRRKELFNILKHVGIVFTVVYPFISIRMIFARFYNTLS